MSSLNPYSLGLLLVALGLVFWIAARLLMAAASSAPISARWMPVSPAPDPPAGEDQAELGGAILLVIRPGGKLAYANPSARQAFGLLPDEPLHLERFSKRLQPTDAFLRLCAAEGHARLLLDRRPLEAVSHTLALQPEPVVVVSLEPPETPQSLSQGAGTGVRAMRAFTDFTQSIAASLDLEATLQAILEGIEKLLPSDYLEVTIWEPESQTLTPYRFLGFPGFDRTLERVDQPYHLGEGVAGKVARDRKTVWVFDAPEQPNGDNIDSKRPILRSYILTPLLVGSELIGTLQLASTSPGSLRSEDLELVQLISGQSAIAVHNALLYRSEQRRAAELLGLAQLTQAFSSVRDPKGLFSRLVQSIVPLIPVEVLGFLLYNESQRCLEGQPPYYGLPSQFLELYRVQVRPGSPAEQALLDQQTILSEDAAADPLWTELGFDLLAQSASLRDTVLTPLVSGGHMLGYLQASNHAGGSRSFSRDELRMLTIIANQVAPLIENATLVQQTRLRAMRAEALRRVASLASSAANLDEILQFSLQELARLLSADVAAAFLIDPNQAMLNLHSASLYGHPPALPESKSSLHADDPQYPFTAVGSQHPFSVESLTGQQPVIPFYLNILREWGLQSAVMVPLIVRDEGIGELWIASSAPASFDLSETQAIVTAAGQLAGVVERTYLSMQTDESLRRRVDQLTALMRVSRELSTSLDPDFLMQLIYDEALRATQADCGTIYLLGWNANAEDAPNSIRLAAGEPVGSRLSRLALEVLEQSEPRLIQSFEPGHPDLPHEGVVMALLAPMLYQGRPIGLIELHARSANRFDESAAQITQSLAAQGAVALANAVQYGEQMRRSKLLKRELETLARLFQVFQVMHQDHSMEGSLQVVADAIQEATPFRSVVISVYRPENGLLHPAVSAGIPENAWKELCDYPQPWSAMQALLAEEYRMDMAYYIPANLSPLMPEDFHSVTVQQSLDTNGPGAWDPDDFLLMPLYNAAGEPLGLISVDAPTDGRRPDRPTFEALELFGMQAGLTIESAHQIGRLEADQKALQVENTAAQAALNEANRRLPELLRLENEHTAAITVLDRQARQLRAGMEVAVLSGQQADEQSVLLTVANGLLEGFDLQAALIGEITPAGPRLVEVVGNVPPNAHPEALFGQRNPLRHMLEDRQILLISDLASDPEWKGNPLLGALDARCCIGLPLVAGDRRSTGLLVVGSRALPPFTEDDRHYFSLLSSQVEVALKNLQLLSETRRHLREVDLLLEFSRKLGVVDPNAILQSLVESVREVIPEAASAWVGLWDDRGQWLAPQVAEGYRDPASLLKLRFTPEVSSLPMRAFLSGQIHNVGEVRFALDYTLSSQDLLNYRRATGGALPISSLLVPFGKEDSLRGLLVLENFSLSEAFNTEEDEDLVLSLTQQAALALDNARLFTAAENRAAQLQALTKVGGIITSSLRSEELIASLLSHLRSVVPYNTATLWLRYGEQLLVAAADGFPDNESRLGLTVSVNDSRLFKDMASTAQAISVANINLDERFPSLISPDRLSWMGIPLISKSVLVGAIALEKTESEFYTSDHVRVAMTFASQAAVSLENARLFEESIGRAAQLDERSQRLALLNSLSTGLAATLNIDTILQVALQHLTDALGSACVSAVLLTESGEVVLQAEIPQTQDRLPRILPDMPLWQRLRESLGIFSTSDALSEPELETLMERYFIERQVRSLLVVPLVTGSTLYGWLWAQRMETYRFNSQEIEMARTISNQAAIAVQNARLFSETRKLTEELERRVEERTQELRREHQNSETLLRIITELSASLDLNQVLTRSLAVLNETLSATQSLILISLDQSKVYSSGEALVSLDDPLSLEREISRWVISRKAPALVQDITADSRWTPAGVVEPAYRSLLAVPLIMGEEVLGSLLLLNPQPGWFAPGQVGLVEAAARQIGVAVNNVELFNLIRDQAENLGSMLREQQIEASRSRAILEAVADGVLVTDEDMQVTLFNASAERILELPSERIVGEPLDAFSGLFGKVAQSWIHTIRQWSQDPDSYQGESYAEQITLGNHRVVSVHLAPVIWRSALLGTVSIFRDITHEVKVDRLKSEFVANVSHELRTPMTSIKGYVEIMLMGAAGQVNDQQRHFLDIIKGNTERLNALVNDILDISRIEAGRITLKLSALDMPEIVEEVFADMRRRSKEENKAMEFALDIPGELPQVSGDYERVRQVLGNLVTNGYTYTPANGRVEVRLSAHELGRARGRQGQRHRPVREGPQAPVRAFLPWRRPPGAGILRHRAGSGPVEDPG